MYGVPDAALLKFLCGRRVGALTFTETTSKLRLDGDVLTEVTFEGRLRHVESSGREHVGTPHDQARLPSLLRLVGATLAEIETVSPTTLRFRFSQGDALELEDADQRYEACQISENGRLIVI